MSKISVKGLAADRRILGALQGGPKSAREIADVLRREVWETWAEANGYDIEWETDNEPLDARILALVSAEERGLAYLFAHQVYPRLRGLERRGLVERIQVQGRRPMLWRAASEGAPERATEGT